MQPAVGFKLFMNHAIKFLSNFLTAEFYSRDKNDSHLDLYNLN